MIALAKRLGGISASSSMAVAQRARELRKSGLDVIDLSTGEPDFPTPSHVCEAGVEAIWAGKTRYDSVAGLIELREAICAKLKRENNLIYQPDQITVGCGAKQAIYNAFAATIDAGDEVLIPAPYWTSYPEIVALAGGVAVPIATSVLDGFKLRPDDLEGALTSRTRWLLLNSPNNPTGAVYSEAELRELSSVLRDHPGVAVLSDDIYEHIVFDGAEFRSIVQVAPELYDRTVVVNGVSKAHAMTGWRVGYAAGPHDLIRMMNVIQSHTTTHTSTISQTAAVAALSGDQSSVREYVRAYAKRVRRLASLLSQVDGMVCQPPDGTFYCYVACAALIGKRYEGKTLESDVDVAKFLLEEAHVAVVPGAAYGLSPYLRLSAAVDISMIDVAVEKIAAAMDRLV